MQGDNPQRIPDFLRGNALWVEEASCVNVRGRVLNCAACQEVCPAGALALSEDGIDVDEDKCTGCGACLPACPTGAMRLSGFAPHGLLAALAGQESVHVHCSASRDGGGGVVIPCHRVLDARLLGAALADGTRVLVLHGLDACGECGKGDANAHVRELGATLREWFGDEAPELHAAAAGEAAEGGARRHEDQPQLSRRGFLLMAGARAARGAAPWLVAARGANDGEALPHLGPALEHREPAAYQALLAQRGAALPWRTDAVLPWRTRTLEDACSACLACAQRCPTGALSYEEDASGRAIAFEAALCTDCALCEVVCPERAVAPRAARDMAEVTAPRRQIMYRALSRCTGCGVAFVPPTGAGRAELCPVCRNEQEIDAEWLAMLER